mgnify:CR=1 FL=1
MIWEDVLSSEPFDTSPLHKLSEDELRLTYEKVSKVAPFGRYGDGMDEQWRDLDPNDALTSRSYRLAEIFSILKSLLHLNDYWEPSLSNAMFLAKNHFKQYGIEDDDPLECYFYPDEDGDFLGGGWGFLSKELGDCITGRYSKLQEESSSFDFEKWVRRYPWRQCKKLSVLYRWGWLRPNSFDYHATNILRWDRVISDLSHPDFLRKEGVLGKIIYGGTQIGASYKAYTLKLDNDVEALRGKKTLQSAREGGNMRKARLQPETRRRLETMKEFINNGHSANRAAELTASIRGLGTAGSNRKLWDRHKK